jgi:hypothetical protein
MDTPDQDSELDPGKTQRNYYLVACFFRFFIHFSTVIGNHPK